MRASGAAGHLTYCTNVHPGETWDDVRGHLEREVPAVKQRVCPDAPFGVGLRLSAIAAATLRHGDGDALSQLAAQLAERGLYVFTLNGFPFGPFHATTVKQAVYAPDWTTPERLQYTRDLADVLVALLPDGAAGSISTVPGGFRPELQSPERRQAVACGLVDAAAQLVTLEQRSGKCVALCVEPEPHCMLETTEEAVAFFEQHLWRGEAFARFERATGLRGDAAAAMQRRHLGLCLDACHAAVEFEQVDALLRAVRRAELPVHKMQLSAGLRIAEVNTQSLEALQPYIDDVYLHQVVARSGDQLERFLDLPDALASTRARTADEWRVHFHVPVFLPDLGAFGNTQPFLRELLQAHRRQPIAAHLEVETYTWGVLPPQLRQAEVADDIARELHWVLEELAP